MLPLNRSKLAVAVGGLLVWAGGMKVSGAEPISFNRDIRPILSDKCFACHGFDGKKRKADLRLDLAEGAYGKAKSGEIAIVPGKPEASEVWVRILSEDKEEVMPPPKSHKSLSAGERELVRRWIVEGAAYQKHWALEAPVKAAIPPVPQQARAQGPIDQFLFSRLQREGLAFQPEASKESLIRRLTLALTGLPPTVAEVDAFVTDRSPEAYQKVVDRLLASEHYGEQMARYWLDVARYGDTHGLHLDNERSIWPYRDWVVSAFNRNLSFKEFTREQLAGDLLPNPSQDQLVATGFNRCNVTTSEGGAIADEFLFRYAVDRTSTTAQAWMGLTAGCAVCHDHKFDPLTQKEFYQLYAFFNRSADPAMDGNALLTAPVLKLSSPEQARNLAEYDANWKAAGASIEQALSRIDYADPATANPPVPAKEESTVLVEDEFPKGAEVVVNPAGQAEIWATEEDGPISSGARSLRIAGKAVAQNYYAKGAAPIEVPPCARLSMMVFLDPAQPPTAVMLQLHTGEWRHRAVWGDPEAIRFGTLNTTTRYTAGELPMTGNWVQLDVDAEKIGLKAGDLITGIAFTLNGGTAYFDQLTMSGRIDDANDPTKSLQVWLKSREGKETQGLPPEINKILKSVPVAQRTEEQNKQVRNYYLANVCSITKPILAPLQAEEARLKVQRDNLDQSIPATLVMRDQEKPRESFVMQRGAYDKPGEKVTPGVPAALPPLPNLENPNRLDLANWLVADNHPLTARVTVNRFWQQLFGIGLVKTSGDFGSQGEGPSHPELLDWLAVSFRESGWDVKKLIREMVLSSAFRQSSAAPAALWKRDPENRLLARGPRFRMDAEELRDNALAISGLLNPSLGGKGVRTYQPPNIWEPVGFVGSNTRFYKADSGPAIYRRSLYTFLKRTAPPPFMVNFDAPSREQSCVLRERSDTPLQALQLMNDIQLIEAARVFAERLMSEGGTTAEQRIDYAYRLALSRHPAPDELALVIATFKQHLASYQQNPEAGSCLIRLGQSKPKPGLPEQELAAWTLVANLLLNLDETLNRQ